MFKKPEHFLHKDRVSFNFLLFIGDKQLFLNVTKCFPEFKEICIERLLGLGLVAGTQFQRFCYNYQTTFFFFLKSWTKTVIVRTPAMEFKSLSTIITEE